MLHLFHGPDDYSSARAAAELVRSHGGEGAAQVTRLDGAGISWPSLRETATTMPMFALAQIIVVRGILAAWTGKGDVAAKGAGKPSPADLARFAHALPETTQLILLEGDLPVTNRYLKELSAAGAAVRVRVFPPLNGPALEGWVNRTVGERGGSIEAAAAALLVGRAGANLQGLAMEIEKLLAHTAPGGAIGRRDVDALVPASEESSAFKLVDAVGGKQPAVVVDLAERLLGAGQAPEQLLALMGTRIRDLLLLHTGRLEGLDAGTVGSRVGWSPGRVAALQRSQRDFTLAELREAQSVLVATDAALKSRPAHERPTLTLLALLTLAQRRGAAELVASL